MYFMFCNFEASITFNTRSPLAALFATPVIKSGVNIIPSDPGSANEALRVIIFFLFLN